MKSKGPNDLVSHAPQILPVIVLRGSDISYLGIVRSLGRLGVPVISVVHSWDGAAPWHSEHSRFCGEVHEIPNPYTQPNEAIRAFETIVRSTFERFGTRLLVLPSSDTNQSFVVDNYERLSGYVRLMSSRRFPVDPSAIINKSSFSEHMSASAPALLPSYASVRTSADIAAATARTWRWPVITKPAVKDYAQSFYRLHGGLKAIEADNPSDLSHQLERLLQQGFELIVQEKIQPAHPEDEVPLYIYVDSSGRVRVAACGFKHTIDPYPFGTAVVLDITWNPALLEIGQQVADGLGWHGLLMIELMRDKFSGTWKIIEVNTRPWLLSGFFSMNGLPFYEFLASEFCGIPIPSLDSLPVATPGFEACAAIPRQVILDGLAARIPYQGQHHLNTLLAELESLGERGYRLSETYCDPSDPLPGHHMLRHLASRHSWPPGSIDQLLSFFGNSEVAS